MIDSDHYVGQVLDEKYRLERLLGRGGMGAVYLATHLGTERYVALKLITPQFMRNEEFVARFKREARAAGRLRHPNVVDVTDFGFAHAGDEPVAYLVMEYLDGCTLGDILTEEKKLPLEWVVDILEQVCSAVHEAHQQGVVHRDLKPENIWLEPNRLGGYRVKVLDFGIAKLADTEPSPEPVNTSAAARGPQEIQISSVGLPSVAENLEIATLVFPDGPAAQVAPEKGDVETITSRTAAENETESENATSIKMARTSTQARHEDDQTLMFDQSVTARADEGRRTNLLSNTTQGTELTRVGAIMGTPLYMSPEQCAAKGSDARSDIYSLGVIAYQMLAGEPPFSGVTGSVMRNHIETAAPDLRGRVKKVPKRAAQVVMSALAKDPADRPQTAVAFANLLRAEADGIGALYRRAFALYSEYFPKFLRLSLIAHLPVIIIAALMIGLQLLEKPLWNSGLAGKAVVITLSIVLALLQIAAYFVAAATISGVTAVIVTQLSVAPLRPVELRTGFAVLKLRWRPFLKTSINVTLRQIIGFVLLVVPFVIVTVRYALYAPVVLMEGLEKKAALRRARELASRSWRTVIIIVLLQILIPLTVSVLIGRVGVRDDSERGLQVSLDDRPQGSGEKGLKIQTSSTGAEIYKQVSGLINILIIPLVSIVTALLYLKMRQLGGEPFSAAMEKIEEIEVGRSEWQRRMRTRLSLATSRSSSKPGSLPD